MWHEREAVAREIKAACDRSSGRFTMYMCESGTTLRSGLQMSQIQTSIWGSRMGKGLWSWCKILKESGQEKMWFWYSKNSTYIYYRKSLHKNAYEMVHDIKLETLNRYRTILFQPPQLAAWGQCPVFERPPTDNCMWTDQFMKIATHTSCSKLYVLSNVWSGFYIQFETRSVYFC